MNRQDFYGGSDPRELPLYSVGEAAGHLHMPAATLRAWVVGRSYARSDGEAFSEPLIRLPDPTEPRLCFNNLVEAHILSALRTKHGVGMNAVRTALEYAEGELAIDRLLLSEELTTDGASLFLDRLGELINLSKSGQIAIRKILESYLRRLERDEDELPIRLYPFLRGDFGGGTRSVVIDPRISFGRPVIAGTGTSTEIVVRRIDAGEEMSAVAEDYGLDVEQVEQAIIYERAA